MPWRLAFGDRRVSDQGDEQVGMVSLRADGEVCSFANDIAERGQQEGQKDARRIGFCLGEIAWTISPGEPVEGVVVEHRPAIRLGATA